MTKPYTSFEIRAAASAGREAVRQGQGKQVGER